MMKTIKEQEKMRLLRLSVCVVLCAVLATALSACESAPLPTLAAGTADPSTSAVPSTSDGPPLALSNTQAAADATSAVGGTPAFDPNTPLDLAALTANSEVSLIGVLTAQTNETYPAVLTLDDGAQVWISAPAPIFSTIVGKRVSLSGVVTQVQTADQPLGLTLQNVIEAPAATADGADQPPVGNTTGLPLTMPDLPDLAAVRLPIDQPALVTYDALVQQAGAALEGYQLYGISNMQSVWLFTLYRAGEGQSINVALNPDGNVAVLPGSVISTDGPVAPQAIDRARLTVDSDDLLAQITDAATTRPTLILAAASDTVVFWTALDGTSGNVLFSVDAISGARR
jgi:hypothetical protein